VVVFSTFCRCKNNFRLLATVLLVFLPVPGGYGKIKKMDPGNQIQSKCNEASERDDARVYLSILF
jgi:hypothetical protein